MTARDHKNTRSPAPGIGVVRLAAWLVPREFRDEWIAEWHAELAYRWRWGVDNGESAPLVWITSIARCLGTVPDAFWIRKRHGGPLMISQDLRFAARTLRKRPGFTAVVVFTLALAIGANAAIFSVVNAVLLRELPFRDPDRLFFVFSAPTDGDSARVARWSSYLNFVDLREQASSFEHLAAFNRASNTHTGDGLTLTGPGLEPTNVVGAAVSASFFATLGSAPIIGRGFTPDEDRAGGANAIVLSHRMWQSRFGSDPGMLGRSITLNGIARAVVGIMPPSFQYPSDAEFWIPAAPRRDAEFRSIHTYLMLGRLKAGVTPEQASAEVRTIARRLEEQYRENFKRTARLEPMRSAVVGNVKPQLAVLAGAVALVLLIGCTNVASVFLARAASREREAAVRTALGAGRARLVRQLLTESVLLSLVGGMLGLVVARWGVQALVAYAPAQLARSGEIGLALPVLVFLLVVSVTAGIAFGALPAWQFARGDALGAVRGITRDGSRGKGHVRTRRALVMAEVALAMVLTASAGLLIKSFVRLQSVAPGFDASNLLVIPLAVPEHRYPDAAKRLAFYDDLRERIAALPGVRSVSVSLEHPLGEGWSSGFSIEGRPEPLPGEGPQARVRPVSPGYFQTVGVPLRAGREIAESDRVGTPGVVVVNQAFVRKYFPGEDPLGKVIRRPSWWPDMPTTYEIVGVVANERHLGLQVEPDPATYFAFAQFALAQTILVRTANDPLAAVGPVREAVWSIDRDVPVENARSMDVVLQQQLATARFNTGLLTLFAFVALALAALGVYGVLSYSVTQRTGEIGIRMALGAPRTRVIRLVVGEGVTLALIGVVGGLTASVAVTRLLSRMLFEVNTLDTSVFASVAALLTLVAALAAFVPARRASRVDPLAALRGE
jgi:putative ABC transport system permease protein